MPLLHSKLCHARARCLVISSVALQSEDTEVRLLLMTFTREPESASEADVPHVGPSSTQAINCCCNSGSLSPQGPCPNSCVEQESL